MASIGAGASAVQYVPQIAEEAAEVTIFQRTPNWIIPKNDRDYTEFEKSLIRRSRLARNLRRFMIFARAEVFAYDGLPVKVGELLASITTSPTLIMALMFIFLVVVGTFMDAIAAMFAGGFRMSFDAMSAITGPYAQAILETRRQAAVVSDSISADEIRRTPDSSAASVVERLTGVTLIGDKYVFVRGLGERYSGTTINGSTLPTTETEKRVVNATTLVDAKKGTLVWGIEALRGQDRSFISGPPRVFGDRVAIGFGDTGTVRGAVVAEAGMSLASLYKDGWRLVSVNIASKTMGMVTVLFLDKD